LTARLARVSRTRKSCAELYWGLVSFANRQIAITHGDSFQELARLTALAPDYLFSGHTHVTADLQKGATRFINPGALHRASVWTVGLLDLASNQLRVLPIINRLMQE
jgi:uncharacterized protein